MRATRDKRDDFQVALEIRNHDRVFVESTHV